MSSQLPPVLSQRFLHWALPKELKQPVLGDLHEEFLEMSSLSPHRANSWYRRQALLTGWRFLWKTKRGVLMFVLSLLVFIALLLMAMVFGGDISMFIDVPSLMLVFPPAIMFSIAVTSWSNFKRALTAVFADALSASDADKYAKVFRVMGNFGALNGVFMSIVGWVAMASHIDAESFAKVFGPALAVSVLTIFYGLGMKLICYVAEQKILFLAMNSEDNA